MLSHVLCVLSSSVKKLWWSLCRATAWWSSFRTVGRAFVAFTTLTAWWRPTSARHTSTTATCTWAPSAPLICASWIWAKCETCRHNPDRCSAWVISLWLPNKQIPKQLAQEHLSNSSILYDQTQSLHFIPFSLFRSDRCLFFVPLTRVADFLFLEMCGA